eukprot:4609406-Prymnesium_polylepis.1
MHMGGASASVCALACALTWGVSRAATPRSAAPQPPLRVARPCPLSASAQPRSAASERRSRAFLATIPSCSAQGAACASRAALGAAGAA